MTATRDELYAALNLVEATLAAEQEARKLPGFSACVVLDQETAWAGGFGKANLDAGTPATAESVYRIASITKPFTAIMLVQGRDAGLVSLDDPVEKLVPRFRLRHRSGVEYKPTFRQLASHTGGLPREAPFDYWTTMQGPTIEQVLASLPQMELTFRPGTENKYSNLGYTLIGHAMELAFGRRYGDYVMEHIVHPLGMRHTTFQPQGETADLLAVGYTKSAGGYMPAPHLNDGDVAPGTRLYASVADIAELIKLQFRDAPTSGGSNVLSGISVREMHAPVLMSPDWSSGISVGYSLRRVGGQTMIGKSGEIPGYTSFMGFIPALRLGAAVFVNSNTQPLQLVTLMMEALIPVVKRLNARPKVTAPAVDAETFALWQRKYVGRYTSLLGEVEIVVRDGGLWMVGTGVALAETTAFIPEGPNAFRMTAGISKGEIAHFVEDEQGRVTRLMLGTIGVTRVGQDAAAMYNPAG